MEVNLSNLLSRGILHTDEYTIYSGVAKHIPEVIQHKVVNYGKWGLAKGDAQVNTCRE